MTQLPPFRGTDCVKCCGTLIAYSYRPTEQRLIWRDGWDTEEIVDLDEGPRRRRWVDPAGECMLATCEHCGWAWLEQCADAALAPSSGIPVADCND